MSVQPWERDVARLENEVRDLRVALERIDSTGTRGILPLTVTVNELVKDVAKLELSLDNNVIKLQASIKHVEDRLPHGVGWRTILTYIGITAPMYGLLAQQILAARGR